MAPSPEYDKEPKAPDKSATNISSEDTKLLHNLINDQHHNSDHKTTNSATNSEVENNKHVEALDDDKLRALLNEALTYKCPKDREGKSSLFKELLEEVEQDDQQACEAAARNLTGCRGSRRGARGRRALPHSNSLQDLVAALAAEPAPRRHHARHHHPAPSNVSARAIHGGSLPSGVDTSSLLSEEASGRSGGGGYLATVRCVNPPPLAERRVSASDANAPHELELLNRRSKPMFPMTYTARATLEIGSGSVCSGRAVTTTTASNQVRTLSPPPPPTATAPATAPVRPAGGGAERGPSAPAPHQDPAFLRNLTSWYDGLAAYRHSPLPHTMHDHDRLDDSHCVRNEHSSRPRNGAHRTCGDGQSREGRPTASIASEPPFEGTKYSEKTYRCRSDEIVHSVVQYSTRSSKSDISVRKTYRERIVSKTLTVPTPPSLNPRNVKSMSVGQSPSSELIVDSETVTAETDRDTVDREDCDVTTVVDVVTSNPALHLEDTLCNDVKKYESEVVESTEDQTSKCFQMSELSPPAEDAIGGSEPNAMNLSSDTYNDIELEEIVCHRDTGHGTDTGSFTKYLAGQKKLLQALEATTDSSTVQDEYSVNVLEPNNNVKSSEHSADVEPMRKSTQDVSNENDINTSTNTENDAITRESKSCESDGSTVSKEVVVHANRKPDEKPTGDRYILAELPNNAYIFLTLPKRPLASLTREHRPSVEIDDARKSRDKPAGTGSCKRKDAISKNALRALLFENLYRPEVDSAIPFSCITTPEVVAPCNTTPAAAHSPLVIDPKPLQLDSEYRAVTSLTGAPPAPPPQRLRVTASHEQPRSVIASSFNGLPLSRPNYGSTATTSTDEYKKSLDENGNSLQSYSSPLSGSSQHKKPRRKKSSKNETVIDCRQLDGYQGDKDVNELLRFIESNAEQRAPKLRAKHKDDADDKQKKRSTERRKDKETKVKRASSLEELSRTKLEDLTAAPRAAPPKPERRSWGDAASSEPSEPPAPADHDFQTVTKKRKPRRRTEEAPARRARAPDPRRRESAPPSERSNDSNDDLDSVHSLPDAPRAPAPPAPPPPPHASYADIARTRHNIPDLIESCNYYAEGESGGEGARRIEAPPPAPPDTDTYPALDGRAAEARRTPRDKAAPPPARRERKERAPAAPSGAPPAPAPDVVADRRPPVILLDSAARPRDMDGVTFGFDINEQLLGGGARRGRCDLLRDAVEPAPDKRPLRYVPPPPPPDHHHLHQIVDYVGAAWEDVVRCGGGKVRYYSE